MLNFLSATQIESQSPNLAPQISPRMKYIVCLVLLFAVRIVAAQQIPNAHSHNDYNQAIPFFHAYNAGFGSIEADVFLRKGILLVAHDSTKLSTNRSLKTMYLEPLEKELKKDTGRRVTLLIDIKENYAGVIPELQRELAPLLKYCKGYAAEGRLQILISGNRPLPALFSNYPDYIYFDEDLKHTYTPAALTKVGQVSLQYTLYSKWKGTGPIPEAEEKRLQHVIDSVHTLGKPIRFWEAPDNVTGWTELLKLHADMIGTDHIDELTAFLRKQH